MARNIYRELNRKISPVPAREIKIDWNRIEQEDFDPWEEELVDETSPWEQAFEMGAEQARDEYFDVEDDL
ncbi:hypothetical protein GF342_02090 [Candidatus Woesearchaeota archaeon]|nr:hypothetical protein [Candidatus Woesearchaeota archaeon]